MQFSNVKELKNSITKNRILLKWKQIKNNE